MLLQLLNSRASKILIILFFNITILGLILAFPNSAQAASCISTYQAQFIGQDPPTSYPAGTISSIPINITGAGFSNGQTFKLFFNNALKTEGQIELGKSVVNSNKLKFEITNSKVLNEGGQKTIVLEGPNGTQCDLWKMQVAADLTCDSIEFNQAGVNNTACLDTVSGPITLTIKGLQKANQPFSGDLIV